MVKDFAALRGFARGRGTRASAAREERAGRFSGDLEQADVLARGHQPPRGGGETGHEPLHAQDRESHDTFPAASPSNPDAKSAVMEGVFENPLIS